MTKHILFTSVLLSSLSLFGNNVPEFRGEARTGVYLNESGLAKKWASSPKMIWKIDDAGEGFLPPSVVDGKLYLNALDATGKKEMLRVFDTNGKLLWEVTYGKARSGSYSSTRTMPTIVGDFAYTITALGEVVCVDLKNKKVAWSVDCAKKYGAKSLNWSFGENALVVDGKVIFTAGGTQTTVLALDAKTGAEAWKTESFGLTASYTSPIAIEHNGKTQIVTALVACAMGLDPASGEILWKQELLSQGVDPMTKPKKSPPKKANSKKPQVERPDPKFWRIIGASPLYKDGKLFMSAGYNAGSTMFELPAHKGELKELWTNPDFDNHHGGTLALNNRIYGANWESNQMGSWMCVDWNTGKTIYNEELKGLSKGSVVSADGMLYIYEEKKGEVLLVNPNSDNLDVAGSFTITDGKGPHWAHIVIADKVMYVKRGEVLMAFDIKE